MHAAFPQPSLCPLVGLNKHRKAQLLSDLSSRTELYDDDDVVDVTSLSALDVVEIK